jgi:hypothetical protein
MALSRKKKIIIGVVVAAVLAIVVVISVVATRKEEPEVVTVKLEVRPELKPHRARCDQYAISSLRARFPAVLKRFT